MSRMTTKHLVSRHLPHRWLVIGALVGALWGADARLAEA